MRPMARCLGARRATAARRLLPGGGHGGARIPASPGAKLCPWTPWGLWGALAPARRGARCRRRGMAAPGAAAMRPHSGAKSAPRRQAVPPFPVGPAGRFGAHKGRARPGRPACARARRAGQRVAARPVHGGLAPRHGPRRRDMAGWATAMLWALARSVRRESSTPLRIGRLQKNCPPRGRPSRGGGFSSWA